jgi:2,4-dienoyl-CoA reductase-like NADH-dependent reductase (Old Yellow Enzyme family)
MSVWGAARVGLNLSPRGDNPSMGDATPALTFSYVGKELGRRKLAFICAREYVGPDSIGPQIKAAFGGVYITNEKFYFDNATQALAEGRADAVAFGKLAIANPDLALRFALQAPLNEWDASTFYQDGAGGYGGAKGYTDYPSLG